MEEKKQRNKFYSAWSKGIVIALFLTRVDKQLLQREKLSGDSGLWTADGFTGK